MKYNLKHKTMALGEKQSKLVIFKALVKDYLSIVRDYKWSELELAIYKKNEILPTTHWNGRHHGGAKGRGSGIIKA